MEAGIALLAGIIIGWLIEWVIDWQYWRRGVAGFYATEAELRSELAEAETALRASAAELQNTQQELHATRAQLQASKVREAELQRRADAGSTDGEDDLLSVLSTRSNSVLSTGETDFDDLTRIKGVSPQHMERMRDAGVTTFVLVAKASPEELREIIQPPTWQHIDFAIWIQEAAELAAQPAPVDEREGV